MERDFQNRELRIKDVQRFVSPYINWKSNAKKTDITFPSLSTKELGKNPSEESRYFDHFAKLGTYAKLLWTDNLITDVIVRVDEYSFNAHKCVLSCYSPYLHKKLDEANCDKIILTGVKPEVLRTLLDFMYTGELKINCQTVKDVFYGARKLAMCEAVELCSQKIRGKDSLLYGYVVAMQLGMTLRWKKAYEDVLHNFEDCLTSQEFLELTCEQLCCLLRGDEIAVRSEVVVFVAVLKWLQHDESRDIYAVRLMCCVRFPLMTMKELLHCFHPPVGKHLLRITEIREMLTDAMCYIAAVENGVVEHFKDLDCKPRTNLLDTEFILWDLEEPTKKEGILFM